MNWFIIANEDMAITVKEDGTLVVMPTPAFLETQRQRGAVETGSEKGKKTFKPSNGLQLLLSLTSEGPIQVHSDLPEDVRGLIGDILQVCCQDAQAQLIATLEKVLTPKQKREELSADEPASEGHTE